MQYKELITNTDFDYFLAKQPICSASNNSGENRREYKVAHNCEWQVAWEDDKQNRFVYDEVDCMCVAMRKDGVANQTNDIVFRDQLKAKNLGLLTTEKYDRRPAPPDQVVWVDLDKIDPEVINIDFWIILYPDSIYRKLDLSPITKLRVRIESDKKELMTPGSEAEDIYQYDIASFPCESTAVKLGSLVRETDGWIYKPVAEGFNTELSEVIRKYGFT